MIQCQNCGQTNADESNFCRSCGFKFTTQSPAIENNYGYSQPRPYSWQTDEFQVSKPDARKTEQKTRVQEFGNQIPAANNFAAQPLAYQQRGQLDKSYSCPHCGSHYLPIVERKISTAGWIVFSVLLVFTLIFFWIGLLMKEEVWVCPSCRRKVS